MKSKDRYCGSCGSTPRPPTEVVPGHFMIEAVAWLAFLLPGLIYSVWRLCSKYPACPVCGSRDLMPPDCPRARRLMYQPDDEDATVTR